DEHDALKHIPPELLFPAPGRPAGHLVMGYDERGHCPMLIENRCSIYAHRPRACRMYDCRVFAATGVEPNSAIAERVRAWEFSYSTSDGAATRETLIATAEELRATIPNATARALRALETYDTLRSSNAGSTSSGSTGSSTLTSDSG